MNSKQAHGLSTCESMYFLLAKLSLQPYQLSENRLGLPHWNRTSKGHPVRGKTAGSHEAKLSGLRGVRFALLGASRVMFDKPAAISL
jgi:hypothetical protein